MRKEVFEGLEILTKEANFGKLQSKEVYFIVKSALEEAIYQSTKKKIQVGDDLEIPEDCRSYVIKEQFQRILRKKLEKKDPRMVLVSIEGGDKYGRGK
jgi:hypothetical protein